jgi:nitrite reductase/ring-hydroxylating ferredoxin subunit
MKHLITATFLAAALCLHAEDKKEAAWQNWFADGSLEAFQVVSGVATYKIENGVLTCSLHDWKFDLATGRCLTSQGHEIRASKI